MIPEAAYTDHDVVHVHMRFGRQLTMMVMMTLMRMVMKMAKIMMMMIVMTTFFKEVNNLHLCVFEEHLDKNGLKWSPLVTIGMD